MKILQVVAAGPAQARELIRAELSKPGREGFLKHWVDAGCEIRMMGAANETQE